MSATRYRPEDAHRTGGCRAGRDRGDRRARREANVVTGPTGGVEMWATHTPETGTIEHQARRAEAAGWDGITFTDSQNLVGDPFVAVALASRVTERLQFATGVTNAHTRHPAALANVAITVQEESGGRFVLGIGRGDTALFHLGRKPMPVARFAERLAQVQAYLAGGIVDCDGHTSRIQWLQPP